MLREIFDNRTFRITVGMVAGVPLSVLALASLPDGLALAIGGMQERNVALALLGPIIILSLVGIGGAWRRLTKTQATMTLRERRIVRLLLYCGIISSTYLTAWAFTVPEMRTLIALPLLALSVGGVIFVLATPR